jgi:hypothetical protein
VKEVDAYFNVTKARFEAEIVPAGRPAILRGLVADWPWVQAAKAGHGALVAAMKAHGTAPEVDTFVGPPSMKGRFFYGPDYRSFNFERRKMAFGALLDLLERQIEAPHPDHIYAGAVRLHEHFKTALDDIPMPLLSPEVERLSSLWIGNRSRTAPHWDLPQNLACVVAARRTFTLFPTDQIQNLYIGPMDVTLAGQPISIVDLQAPDFERFPKFRTALEHAEIAELEPGDALYLPSLWVHHVACDAPLGAMVNFWWRDGPDYLLTPFLTLLHGLTTIRDMPERERMAWREIFDHFVFKTHGEPQPHLPEAARGVFGEMTPQTLQAIRAHLARSLTR